METRRPDPSVGGEPVLVVATPAGFTRQYRFAGAATLVVGRDATAALAIPDDSVSRWHAELRASPLAIRDLGSTNGTRVQGREIGEAWVELTIGLVIELGDAVVLVRSSQALGDDAIVPARRDDRRAGGGELVAASAEMQRLEALIALVAPSRLGVLILGETGAGKEVVARAVHRGSPRHAARLLALNCAAIAPSLIEAELFGFEKGAFTGATQAKPGLFEAAAGGTVLLDEIGEMPLDTQAKLLRVLESGEVLRVGALEPITVDVRFVAATHRDLVTMAEQGKFRLDLLFRISGVTLAVPALRDRLDDLLPLATRFLAQLRPGGPRTFSEAAVQALRAHRWPGNVRELRSTIERAELLSRGGVIDVAHLAFGVGVALGDAAASSPAATRAPAPAGAVRDELAALERERILAALAACGGNQSRAARSLGMSRATLVRRLGAYGVQRPRK